MAFLNLDLDFFAHPKCARLVGLIGRDSEVFPLRLWAYTAKYHSVDGKLSGYSPQAIERIVQWGGQPGQCVDALAAVGFIDKIGESDWKVHDWVDYQGHIHALKLRNKKVAKNRWKNMRKSGSTVDTSGIPKSTSGVPQSLPFQSLPFQPVQEKTEQNQKSTNIGPPRPSFQRPSVDQVRDFIRSNRYDVEADTFHSFYESNGWKVGRNPMKDWKASVRTWHGKSWGKGGSNGNKNSGGNGPRPGGSAPREDGSKFDGIGEVVEV
jgi:hypothetical protein